jgi:hypothetical protein
MKILKPHHIPHIPHIICTQRQALIVPIYHWIWNTDYGGSSNQLNTEVIRNG